MLRFYRDETCSAFKELKAVEAASDSIAGALVGCSGTQKAGEDAKDYLYHHEPNPPAWLYCKLKEELVFFVRGYVFFRYCPSAPNQWLVISMGLGRPGEEQCMEALRRFSRSFNA